MMRTIVALFLIFLLLFDISDRWNSKPNRSALVFRVRDKKAVLLQPLHENISAVTYTFSGGRLGDNLLSYFHAKWIAYKHGLPFLYRPFPNAELFALHNRDQQLEIETSSLYVVPYFPETTAKERLFDVDWSDPVFRKEMAECLTPMEEVSLHPLPKDRKTVGVHVRRGGGFDHPEIYYEYPLKFPPDSYYIEQIERVAALFPDEPLYVFILTDDPNPESIGDKFQKALQNPNIEFAWRKGENGPDQNILEDFFLIPQFDVLILCDSNFSLVASKISEPAAIFIPTGYVKKKGKTKITRVELSQSDIAICPEGERR